jgi:hypothetical protein
VSIGFATSLLLTGLVVAPMVSADDAKAEDLALSRAEAWLSLVDQGQYAESWEAAAQLFKGRVSKDSWTAQAAGVRNPLGKVVSRKLKSSKSLESAPGAPDGKYVVIQYDTIFENKKAAVETVTPMLDSDGTWRVSGYFIR